MKSLASKISKHKNLSLFIALFVLGGIISVLRGQDNYFDLQNYHLYNPFAFLTGRTQDIIPAGIHSLFNPLLDIPYYLLLKYFSCAPRLVAFLMALPYAVCAFFTVKIAGLIFKPAAGAEKYFKYLAVALGLSGVMALSLCGSSSGDEAVGAFMLAALYFILRDKKIFWLAGILCGAGLGLKLTAGPMAAGIFIAAALSFNRSSLKSFFKEGFVFGVGFLGGLLAVNGYFMYKLYLDYANPIFPFFNNIFKSPMFTHAPANDPYFLPKNLVEAVYKTLSFAKQNIAAIPEPSRDLRIPFAFLSSVFLTADILLAKIKKVKSTSIIDENKILILSIFWLTAYIFWAKLLFILRYIAGLDFLTGILAAAFFVRFIKIKDNVLFFMLACGVMIGYTNYPYFQEAPFKEKTVLISDTKIPNGALVMQMDKFSYIIPFANPDAVYIGGVRNDKYLLTGQEIDIYDKHNFRPKIQQKINSHAGQIYVIEDITAYKQNIPMLKSYGLEYIQKAEECLRVESNLNEQFITPIICEVKKAAVLPAPQSHKTF